MADTIAAVATGPQTAAIGIIRLSGEDAVIIADRLFTPAHGGPMRERKDRTLVFGTLRAADGGILDACLCTVSRAPKSYTGEDTAELQCHGSPVLLRTVLEELFALGARQAAPGEFTKRAFLNGRLELTAAEAVADLIDAETEESVRNAAGQLTGAVAVKAERVYSVLAEMYAHYLAVLDYPDEDIEDFRLEQYESTLSGTEKELRALLATFERGKLMNSGIPCAITGCPNAGKSSLLNALLGYERAIVTSVPGTTRDTVEERVRLGALTLRLIDTAGIRETSDEIERLGVERSRRAVESAELVLAVIDGSREPDAEDEKIIRLAENAAKAVVVLSKSDITEKTPQVRTSLPVVSVSSVTLAGIETLAETVRALFPAPQVPAGEILTNTRHAEAISRAVEHIAAAEEAMRLALTPDIVLTEVEGAMTAIGELSGRTVREDVTEKIFSRFCVGK